MALSQSEKKFEARRDEKYVEESFPHSAFEYIQEFQRSFQSLLGKNHQCLTASFAIPILLFVLQGCMYSPKYADHDSGETSEVSDPERERRETLIRETIEETTPSGFVPYRGVKRDWRVRTLPTEFDTPEIELMRVLMPSVDRSLHDYQRERIFSKAEYLMEEASSEYFEHFLKLAQAAKSYLGITNFDRYAPELIEEVLDNYLDPEKKSDLPVIIALIQRKDTSIACINPLNVYTHELQELTERNKLIIVEADAPEEIIFHLNRLIVSGVLPKGKLKSIILGAHGTRYTTGVGIAAPSTYSLQSLDQYFMERPIVVLAGCDTGLGRDDEQNLSHFFKLALPSAEIVSCDSLLLGIDFHEEDVDQDELIELNGLLHYLSLGVVDTTYRPDLETAQKHSFKILDEILSPSIPRQYIRECIRAGVFYGNAIEEFHAVGFDLSLYSPYLEHTPVGYYPYNVIADFYKNHISPHILRSYNRIGVFEADFIIQLHKNGITSKKLDRLIDLKKKENTHAAIALACLTTESLLRDHIPFDAYLSFYEVGITDYSEIQHFIELGIDPKKALHMKKP